jgi:hypothetical protein
MGPHHTIQPEINILCGIYNNELKKYKISFNHKFYAEPYVTELWAKDENDAIIKAKKTDVTLLINKVTYQLDVSNPHIELIED